MISQAAWFQYVMSLARDYGCAVTVSVREKMCIWIIVSATAALN
jgi:hypothetical protein